MIEYTFKDTKNIDKFSYNVSTNELKVTYKSKISYNYYGVYYMDVSNLILNGDKEVPKLKRFKYKIVN